MITYDLIGNTPLVLLEHYSDDKVKIYLNLNNGILEAVLKTTREILHREGNSRRACACRSNYCFFEATAGNTGMRLLAADQHRLKCKIFAPYGFSEEKINIMIALGADVSRGRVSLKVCMGHN